jgi:hypothetical protein
LYRAARGGRTAILGLSRAVELSVRRPSVVRPLTSRSSSRRSLARCAQRLAPRSTDSWRSSADPRARQRYWRRSPMSQLDYDPYERWPPLAKRPCQEQPGGRPQPRSEALLQRTEHWRSLVEAGGHP